MQCDKCNSDNTQRLEVIYEGGTQNINTESKTAGAGFSGAFGIGGAVTSTTGTSQSILAQKASPPAKKSLFGAIFGIIIGYFFLGNGIGTTIIGLAIIGASVYFGYKAFQFNEKEWPSLYQYWKECWMCHKCGNVYHRP